MTTKGVFAFITGYTFAYSAAMAVFRFSVLFALNFLLGLGFSLGVLLLVVYAAHLASNTWQAGVAQAAQRYRQKAAEEAKAAIIEARKASGLSVPYEGLSEEERQKLN